MTARMNPRDPLTLRIPRTLAETRRDPWAYAEGNREPRLLDGAAPWRPGDNATRRGHSVVAWLSAIGLLIVLHLLILGLL